MISRSSSASSKKPSRAPPPISFARATGFLETGQILQNCSLTLEQTSSETISIARGIRILALSKVAGRDDQLLRNLHAISNVGSIESNIPFEVWEAGFQTD